MARELKQDRALASLDRSLDGSTRSARPSAPPSSHPARADAPSSPAPSSRSRESAPSWFDALDPAALPPPPRPSAAAAIPLMMVAVVLAVVVPHAALRVLLPLALLLAAGVIVYRARRGPLFAEGGPLSRWLRVRPDRSERLARRRGLELDSARLTFRSGSPAIPPASRTLDGRAPTPVPPISLPPASAGRSGLRARRSFDPAARPRAGRDSLAAPAPASGQTMLELSDSFGVTLLAPPRRDKLVALLSSASGTFYVGAAFDAAARRAFAPLLDRATIVVAEEAGLDAIGPDGEALLVAPDELATLLDALVEQSPSCLDRFVLTDARGAELSLDGRTLSAGDRKVDLGAPLEWKPIVFQESFGQAVAVYQGTWIRQGGTELVLVCLLPSLGPAFGVDLDVTALDRGALRDLRLMQASPEQPPPSEQRVAIERLFMVPVRSALDRAPRAAHQAAPGRARA